MLTPLLPAAFAVDGTKIPDVDFDIGESYAGLLPISDKANETRKLYFWYVRRCLVPDKLFGC